MRGLFSLDGIPGLSVPAAGDDDAGQNGINASAPEINGIRSNTVTLVDNAQPIAAMGETGIGSADDDGIYDVDVDLTIDFGFFRKVAVGNMVFFDVNNDGKATSGEGVNGVTMELYDAFAIPGLDSPLATTVTTNGGRYSFDSLRSGAYVVHVPRVMFAPGAPLYTKVSIAEGLFGVRPAFAIIKEHSWHTPFVQTAQVFDGCDHGHFPAA
jgi:hypothetical protein